MRPSDSPEMDKAALAEQDRAEFAHSALENLFDVSPNAIFVTDAQGVIRCANPRAAELFGYSQAEFYGMPTENLIPRRFRGRHPSHRENFNANPRTRQMGAALNLFGLRKDGTEFPVDILLQPMQTPTGMVVLSFVRDNTEVRDAQEALRRTDLQLRSILETIQDYAIYLLDPDGCVMTWNPGAERIKGYTSDEVLDCTSHAFLRTRILSAAGRRSYCVWPHRADAWRKRAGESAKTARASGPTQC